MFIFQATLYTFAYNLRMLQKENTKPFLQEHQKPHRCFRLTHKEQRLSDMRDDDT